MLRTRPARDWARELNDIGVPAGAVFSLPDILDHPQIAGRGMLATYETVAGVDGSVTALRTGVKLDGAAPQVDSPPPALGEHSAEILAGAGFSKTEIAQLQKDGII